MGVALFKVKVTLTDEVPRTMLVGSASPHNFCLFVLNPLTFCLTSAEARMLIRDVDSGVKGARE